MPTPLSRSENMRKHLTKAERQAREETEADLRRETRVTLKAPEWLSEEARKVWDSVKRKVRGLDLLDNLDAEMLGIYCNAVASYQILSKQLAAMWKPDENGKVKPVNPVEVDLLTKTAQAWSRIALQYAEKLGLTPSARARLARKKATEQPKDELEELLDNVTDFVNGDA